MTPEQDLYPDYPAMEREAMLPDYVSILVDGLLNLAKHAVLVATADFIRSKQNVGH